MPILRAYLPGLLAVCQDQRKLAERMVRQWLEQYMLKEDSDKGSKAEAAAAWFAGYQYFGSHSRRVSIEDVQRLNLAAVRLEDNEANPELQDAVLSVHHCFSVTHSNTPAAKIIENHLGHAYVKMIGEIVIQAPAGPAEGRPVAPTRAERRREQRGQ